MAHAPKTVSTVGQVRSHVGAWRRAGARIALVPTMGALHEGHLSLCRLGLRAADRLIVSIFVNPRQFATNEDLATYPRRLAADVEKLAALGVHAVYAPGTEEIYPPGFSTTVHVAGISDALCGKKRPGHFEGVATVVTKLLLQTCPDVAVFGEKDYQQLQVIRRLVRDLDMNVEIIAAPTVRETDGLALSSRNAYLASNERNIAPMLQETLLSTAAAIRSGKDVQEVCALGIAALEKAGFGPVDYLELRDAETLEPMQTLDRPGRLLAAAWLGARARLIDNIAVEPR